MSLHSGLRDSQEEMLLELICGSISGKEPTNEAIDISLWDIEIKRAGLRFDEAMVSLRDFEARGLIHDVQVSQDLRDNETYMTQPVSEHWMVSFVTWPGIRSALDDYQLTPIEKLAAKWDKKSGTLKIGNHKIVISERGSKTVSEYVLEHIFDHEDVSERFFFTEIAEKLFADEPYNEKRYYRACEAINHKVLKVAKIEGFMIYSSGKKGWVRINPQFLP